MGKRRARAVGIEYFSHSQLSRTVGATWVERQIKNGLRGLPRSPPSSAPGIWTNPSATQTSPLPGHEFVHPTANPSRLHGTQAGPKNSRDQRIYASSPTN